jgi:hypothetical protein
MHIYERLNSNIQNKIDYYIKKNNKILQKQLNYEIIFYFFKKNINSNSIFKKNINFVNHLCTIF